MVIILRNRDMKNGDVSGAIRPLEKVTFDDVIDELLPACERADIVIYIPEDCSLMAVLKDAVFDTWRKEHKPDLKVNRVYPRTSLEVHRLITFGQLANVQPL
jgi:hypothetical protein